MQQNYFFSNQERQKPQAPLYYQEASIKKSKKEIGDTAAWHLSSAKHGNGIHQLRDNNLETFWQSDGPIPHIVTLQFPRKTRISELAIYLDVKTDESYTPEVLLIKGGIHIQHLKEIVQVTLENPVGWIMIPLTAVKDDGSVQPFVYTMNIQLSVLQMFHSGKDTHVRQIKIFGVVDTLDQNEMNDIDLKEAFSLNNFLR